MYIHRKSKGVYLMTGKEIQEIIKRNRLYQWEVAQELHISEFTLSRWFRENLNEEREKLILEAVEKLLQRE